MCGASVCVLACVTSVCTSVCQSVQSVTCLTPLELLSQRAQKSVSEWTSKTVGLINLSPTFMLAEHRPNCQPPHSLQEPTQTDADIAAVGH